jgi:hypothetical protein
MNPEAMRRYQVRASSAAAVQFGFDERNTEDRQHRANGSKVQMGRQAVMDTTVATNTHKG